MKLNASKSLITITFLCCFMLPTYLFNYIFNVDVVEYLFLIVSLLLYVLIVITNKKISKFEFFSTIVILILCIVRKSIAPLYLVELLVAYKLSDNFLKNGVLLNKKVLFISLLFVGLYSILYFGHDGRYIYTGLKEINQSGFAIFMLFLIIRKQNKNIGNILLLLGNLTFSRNYLLCLIIFWFIEKFKNTKFFEKIYKYLNFRNLFVGSVLVLLFFAFLFDNAYKNNKLSDYQTGFKRYLNIYDYSNYFRFSINKKLIDIYIDNPSYLLTGLDDEEFYELSYKYSVDNAIPYRRIKPHNYFFSYFRIYGIFSSVIFVILGKIMNKLVNKNNVSILLVLFIYANILGIGFANYWLFLTIIALCAYRKVSVN